MATGTVVDFIVGAFFLVWFFHTVQWYLQIGGLGGKPIWFRIYRKIRG